MWHCIQFLRLQGCRRFSHPKVALLHISTFPVFCTEKVTGVCWQPCTALQCGQLQCNSASCTAWNCGCACRELHSRLTISVWHLVMLTARVSQLVLEICVHLLLLLPLACSSRTTSHILDKLLRFSVPYFSLIKLLVPILITCTEHRILRCVNHEVPGSDAVASQQHSL